MVSSAARRTLVVALLTAIALISTMAADRVVGGFIHDHNVTKGLIFPPHSEVSYTTTEFRFSAAINGLGFRDREFAVERTANYRIIAIGDSFTYGWGVQLEQSWPKVMEQKLRDKSLSVEVANLGAPGTGPGTYAAIAERAVPVLKPDLIIVAVLQGDDLVDSMSNALTTHETKTVLVGIMRAIRLVIEQAYPTAASLARATNAIQKTHHIEMVTPTWKGQAQRILDDLNPDQRRRYGNLDPLIKHAFVSGELNPALIHSALHHPQYFLDTFDVVSPNVQRLIDEMSKRFGQIKVVAERHHAKVLIVSVPFGIYVSRSSYEMWRRYGFVLDDAMLSSDAPDQAIRMAAEKAGLQFFAVTERFRNARDLHFFFRLDGHFEASGHQFYADLLTPIIARELALRTQCCL